MNTLELRRRTLGKGVYKKIVEGNPAIAQGSLARRYPGIAMQGWTEQNGTPTPEAPVPIVSAGTQNQDAGKYQYEVKLTGKNLFDISKVITDSGLLTNNGDGTLTATPNSGSTGVCGKVPNTLRDFCPELISGETYHLSADTTGTMKQIYLLGTNISWYFGTQRTITDTDLESIVYFYASGINTEAVISDIMITEVEGADYEPYRLPQTVTLTSDRPLTKWDKLVKKDSQWGWVYKSAEIVLDGSEKWSLYPIASSGTVFLTDLSNATFGLQTSLCDKYRNIDYAWAASYNGMFGIYGDNTVTTNKYFRPPSADVETVEQWKTWLQSNPLTLWYETAEETFVPLSESEQEALNALHTFRPTTVLSNDCDCNMTLTYKTKKSLEVAT